MGEGGLQEGAKMQNYLCSMSEISFLPFSNSNSVIRCSVILSDIRLACYSSPLFCVALVFYTYFTPTFINYIHICAYISKCI